MKNLVLLMLMLILCTSSFYSAEETEKTKGKFPAIYVKQSKFTDPGKYAFMYDNLPESLPELCKLIKSQFLHPYTELPRYKNTIPKERWREFLKFTTTEQILKELVSLNPKGVIPDRKPEQKLIMGCRDYAVVLVSVLRHRGIPARIRFGHATYLIPDFHTSHTICEVWNSDDKRWMLVDPATNMIDFSRQKFDFSYQAWNHMQDKKIDPEKYGSPGKGKGAKSIYGKIPIDLAALLGYEPSIFEYAPILDEVRENNGKLTEEHITLLNKVSKLMESPEGENLTKLKEIYNSTPSIQITRVYNPGKKRNQKKVSAK